MALVLIWVSGELKPIPADFGQVGFTLYWPPFNGGEHPALWRQPTSRLHIYDTCGPFSLNTANSAMEAVWLYFVISLSYKSCKWLTCFLFPTLFSWCAQARIPLHEEINGGRIMLSVWNIWGVGSRQVRVVTGDIGFSFLLKGRLVS